jgi:hypothetical protein
MTTEEKNCLIADFRKYPINPDGSYEMPEHGTIRPDGSFKTYFEPSLLKFHKQWNWIMPVAIHIATTYGIDCISKRFTIEEIFESVVDFINLLNESKK